jgi:hypothetical protein
LKNKAWLVGWIVAGLVLLLMVWLFLRQQKMKVRASSPNQTETPKDLKSAAAEALRGVNSELTGGRSNFAGGARSSPFVERSSYGSIRMDPVEAALDAGIGNLAVVLACDEPQNQCIHAQSGAEDVPVRDL